MPPLRRCLTPVLLLFATVVVAAPDPAAPDALAPDALAVESRGGSVRRHVDVPRIDAGPVIDGVLDDAAWADAGSFDDFTQVDPIEGAAASQRTEVRLLHDARHLYVGIRCFDDDPGAIISTEMRRDADFGSDDRVAFIIDTFLDRRNAFRFEMNASGARADALIEDNSRVRQDWDAIWFGATTIDDSGWTAEIAIPFQSLSFTTRGTVWGFNVSRTIRRTNERVQWASPQLNTGLTAVGASGEIRGLADIEQGLGLDVKPFGILKYRHEGAGGETFDADAGLDLVYRLTPSLTASLTFNTDFAETEVDARRINLTRFPLFFPEKRDFFLEDAGIFSFGGINNNPLPFHSRRIGLGPSGEAIDVLAGAKLTGRVDQLNIGALVVHTDAFDDIDAKTLGVVRTSLNVLDESTIGLIATSGSPTADRDNTAVGADFNFRDSTVFGDRIVDGHLWYLQSVTGGESGDDEAFGFKLGYPNDALRWQIGASQIGDEFNAALGFVPRPGIREYFGNVRLRWRPDDGPFRSVETGVSTFLVTDLDDRVESHDLRLDLLSLTTRDSDSVTFFTSRDREVISGAFPIRDGIVIPADDYRFGRYGVTGGTSSARPISARAGYTGGTFYAGTRDDVSVGLTWRPSRHLLASVDYAVSDIDLPEGDFMTRLVSGRVNVYLTPDLSWTSLVQYDNLSDSIGLNSRVQWIIDPGNTLYVVLNQGYRYDGGRLAPETTEVTTKLGWTFRF